MLFFKAKELVAHRRLLKALKRGGKKLLFSFQKFEAGNASKREFVLLVVYTVLLQKRTEKKTFTRFYALSLFPTSQYIKKRDTPRARSHQFLAEEISKGSILVREVAREIRRGRFLRVFESRAFYIFFFLVPSGLGARRGTLFSVT